MSKQFWGVLAVIAVILVSVVWMTNKDNNTQTSNTQPTNHVEGSNSTGVNLVEYGDYQCPYCGEYYSVVQQVAAQYSGQITFQFRNLPLTSLHPNAFAAARAAEAAALQGKFWQMHDLLYEQNVLYYSKSTSNWVAASDPETYFVQYAQELGLNVTKFKQDYEGNTVNNSINADVAAFNKTGAEEATPTFFLDGKQIQPSITTASFDTLINAAIKQKTGKTSTVAPPSSSTPVTTNDTTDTSKQ
jgi:protein-disulfide isomerase